MSLTLGISLILSLVSVLEIYGLISGLYNSENIFSERKSDWNERHCK
jgi:hypothetical protein